MRANGIDDDDDDGGDASEAVAYANSIWIDILAICVLHERANGF